MAYWCVRAKERLFGFYLMELAYPGIDFCGKLLPLSYLYSMSVFLSLKFGKWKLGLQERHRALCLYWTWYHSLSIANVVRQVRVESVALRYSLCNPFSSSDLISFPLILTFPPGSCSFLGAGMIRAS